MKIVYFYNYSKFQQFKSRNLDTIADFTYDSPFLEEALPEEASSTQESQSISGFFFKAALDKQTFVYLAVN